MSYRLSRKLQWSGLAGAPVGYFLSGLVEGYISGSFEWTPVASNIVGASGGTAVIVVAWSILEAYGIILADAPEPETPTVSPANPAPRRKTQKQAWEVPGARTKEFGLKEMAFKFTGEPFTDRWVPGTTNEEFHSLYRFYRRSHLEYPENPMYISREIVVDRAFLRRYLNATGRPIPEFLDQRFDDAI